MTSPESPGLDRSAGARKVESWPGTRKAAINRLDVDALTVCSAESSRFLTESPPVMSDAFRVVCAAVVARLESRSAWSSRDW